MKPNLIFSIVAVLLFFLALINPRRTKRTRGGRKRGI